MKQITGLLVAGAIALIAASPAAAQSAFRLRSTKIPASSVQKVEDLAKFYQAVTGAKSVRRVERPGFLEILLSWGATQQAAETPSLVRLVIISRPEQKPAADTLGRVVLEVTSMDAAVKSWTDHGGKLDRPPAKSASGATVGFVRDPEGNLIELVQP